MDFEWRWVWSCPQLDQQSCLARSVVLVDRWWQIHFGAQELDDSNRTTPKTLYFSETSSQDAFSAA
jgi:hypothetical protein